MRICFNGWFSGFIDKTNPGVTVDFFLDLFDRVYGEPCEVGDADNSDILCEFDTVQFSAVHSRAWKHTYLFSGESRLTQPKSNYTCVLWGERNHANVVNVPLFVSYLYTNRFVDVLEQTHLTVRTQVPTKDVCVVISNDGGQMRNRFLDKLERVMSVDYAGGYRTNVPKIAAAYNTPEFREFISQYKFVVSMENSREDTYITEKVVHGLLAKTVPIYWGSTRISEYINPDRIISLVDDGEMDAVINRILDLRSNTTEWLNMVNRPVFPNNNNNNKLERTIDAIAKDIRHLLSESGWKRIAQTYCVSNPAFEPDRCSMMSTTFAELAINPDSIRYISPTYGHTISQEQYSTHVKSSIISHLRYNPLKTSELSLYLNYKAVLEDIAKNYKDGVFFVFESDAMKGKDIAKLREFVDFAYSKKSEWDLIHLGMFDSVIFGNSLMDGGTGYRNNWMFKCDLMGYISDNRNGKSYIEDITTGDSPFRLIRKFHTRCTDSFLWTYDAVVHFLDFMNRGETDYAVPFDYYMCNFFEKNVGFRHYWSVDEFFVQGSNLGLMPTTIQK